jgi:hypothetical protein
MRIGEFVSASPPWPHSSGVFLAYPNSCEVLGIGQDA